MEITDQVILIFEGKQPNSGIRTKLVFENIIIVNVVIFIYNRCIIKHKGY